MVYIRGIGKIFKQRREQMIAIGNGEHCPFCKGKDKFINQQDNDFLQHLTDKHPEQMEKALFGGESVGI